MTDRLTEAIRDLTPQQRALLAKRMLAKRESSVEGSVIPRREDPGRAPLSFAQERMWIINRMAPGDPAYNIADAILIEGELDLNALRRSLNELVRRHESLRTRFTIEDGEPVQIVCDPFDVELPHVHLDSGADVAKRARHILAEQGRRPFDLEHEPPIRVGLMAYGDRGHLLLVTLHHIISDGWSRLILARELSALYEAFRRGDRSPLAELLAQYPDYAEWQRRRVQGEMLRKEMAYWKEHLAGLSTLELPTDRPRPAVLSSAGAFEAIVVPDDVARAVKRLGHAQGLTPFMSFLAIFTILLHRYTGQEDIVLGTPITGRNRVELEDLIGFFVNLLALRIDLSGDPSGREVFARVREVVLEAMGHQELPFAKLVDELQPRRDPSRNPIFQVGFLDERQAGSGGGGGGMRLLGINTQTTRFDIEARIIEGRESTHASFLYSTDLFEAATIRRMLAHYEMLLRGFVEDPDRRISQLPMLSTEERRQLLIELNDNEQQLREDQCVHELFEARVAEQSDAVALVAGDRSLTYGELDARANRLAHALRSMGVAPEVPVGLFVKRSPEMVVGLLAILKAGGAYVPMDPAYPKQRLAFMLADLRTPLLLTQERLVADLPEHDARVFCLDADWDQVMDGRRADPPRTSIGSDHLAYVMYTSGSTGSPKGVLVEHRNVCHLACAQIAAFGIRPDSRVLQFASSSFDASVSEVFTALAAGAALVLVKDEALLPGPDLVDLLRRQRVTTVTLPPSVLKVLPDADLPDLETIVSAGEACTADLVKRWAKVARFINAYGPTEITVCATLGTCDPSDERAPSIGRPMANVKVYLLNAALGPVPIGVVGEVYVGGPGVARGYSNRPDLTAERFVPNPFGAEGARLYRTGDLARFRADGSIEYVGRADHQVKVRGYRIEPGEIEATLREHADVQDVVVVKRTFALAQTADATPPAIDADARGIELWPSVAEFFVYDELLYHAMTGDERRNDAYRAAIDGFVKDRIVLDIGTGADAILARFCAEGGARKVYAIELLEDSYRGAKATIERLGLADRIHLIHGNAMEVELPEPVDVCVSEIVGAIGGSEGAAAIINDAWRFMKDGGVMIPDRSTTKIAAISLPDDFIENPVFNQVGARYVDKVFEQVGYRFDLRLCLKNLTRDDLVSSVGTFEDLDFMHPIGLEGSHPIELRVYRDGRVSGFLVWLELQTMPGHVIDVLDHEHCWLPVFLPVFHPPIEVSRGDVIRAEVTRTLCENGLNPDYRIVGTVRRPGRADISFDYTSHHFRNVHRATPFYAHVFDGDHVPTARSTRARVGVGTTGDDRLVAYLVSKSGEPVPADELGRFLRERVPEYMVPSHFVPLKEMPLTPNGKIDRAALPAPDERRSDDRAFVAPRSELEEQIAKIWRELLGVEQVGLRDNFFDLGGHSLTLVTLHQRLVEEVGCDFAVTELFQYTTIESLAERLSGDALPAVSLHDAVRLRASRRLDVGESAIAVIAMAGRLPGARDVETFWSNLRSGVESIRFFTDEELSAAGVPEALLRDPNYVKARAVIDGEDLFDAWFFGYSPREAELIDPQQRVFLECAHEVLERAGYDPDRYPGMIGVYAGVGQNSYMRNIRSRPELISAAGGLQVFTSNDKDFLPTRVSYKLDLHGPSVTVQTACSTSLVAVHEACQSLLEHRCDLALAGGVTVGVQAVSGQMYTEGGIISPDGHCRAFDAKARGTVSGNGAGIVALKRLDEALRDGDEIHAVIRGTATNNDGSRKVGYTAPSVEGQAEAIALAQAMGGVAPETITYVEAHGTGTALGDPIEVAALQQVFGERTDRTQFCALGSLKSNMGHLDAAAGVAGLIKTVLALEHGEIPPSLHFETANPEIDFAKSAFFVNTELRPWTTEDGTPRRAGVSSFGLGGTNAHAVLEEAPEPAPSGPSRDHQVLVLSAKTDSALDAMTSNLASHLRAHPEVNLADVAHTLQVGRRELEYRRAVACASVNDVVETLDGSHPRRRWTRHAAAGTRPVVFMFPGGGAQYPGMGLGLYERESVFRRHIDAGIEALREFSDYDFRTLLLKPQDLADARGDYQGTSVQLPAIFLIEYALAQLWMSWGIRPASLLGHSVGENTAACLAGVISFKDALGLVTLRGELLEQVSSGGMLSVPLAPAELEPVLGDELDLAVVNTPQLCVVSGRVEDLDALEKTLGQREIESRRVRISIAAHSRLLDPALGDFGDYLRRAKLSAPEIPFVSNLTGTWITAEQATSPDYWVQQFRNTVRFGDCVKLLLDNERHTFLEVGPGKALSSLVRQHPDCKSPDIAASSLRHPDEDVDDSAFFATALGHLWTGGVSIDWSRYRSGEQRRRVTLPTYPFERQRFWIEPRPRAGAGRRRADLADWFYVPSWHRSSVPAPIVADGGTGCLVFADDSPLGRELVTRLEAAERQVTVVEAGDTYRRVADDRYLIDPAEPAHYVQLLSELRERARPVGDIVHLWGVTGETETSEGDDCAERHRRRGFDSLLFLGQAIGGDSMPIRITVVTDGVRAVTGDETIHPEKALVLGPALVLGCEFPEVDCRHIDVEVEAPEVRNGTTAELLARDVRGGTAGAPVAYRGGHRFVQSWGACALEAVEGEPVRLRQGGVYLITGGLGGIGSVLGEFLARSVGAKLVLVGRTRLPARADWTDHLERHDEDEVVSKRIRAIEAIEAAGGEVLVTSADVTDFEQMSEVVREATRRFGGIDGVIHAAGIPGGRMIELLEPNEAAAVMAPKVLGSRVLKRLFADAELDFMLLCSSLNVVQGAPGQVAYTAANVFLDAFAHRFSSETGTFTVSVNWNRWREVGMAVDHARSRGHAGVLHGGSNEEEIELFRRVLAHAGSPQVAISELDLRDAFEAQRRSDHAVETERGVLGPDRSVGEAHPRPNLATEYVSPRTDTEQALTEIWELLLGIEEIGVQDNFFDLGGHSLLMVQAVALMQKRTGVRVGLREFAPNNLGQLAAVYDVAVADAAQASAAAPSKRPLWRRLVSSLAQVMPSVRRHHRESGD